MFASLNEGSRDPFPARTHPETTLHGFNRGAGTFQVILEFFFIIRARQVRELYDI